MIDLRDVEKVRPKLVVLCRNPAFRINPPDVDVRNRWWPYRVRESATLSVFTDAGAWEFIAECLARGVKVECRPPCAEHDDFAYVLKEADGGEFRRIYMKVAIRPPVPRIVGLSFHLEDPR